MILPDLIAQSSIIGIAIIKSCHRVVHLASPVFTDPGRTAYAFWVLLLRHIDPLPVAPWFCTILAKLHWLPL
jgi:hypothetical protein